MKKIMGIILIDLFWTYIPVVLIVVMACIFATFFPEVWGKLTIGWIVITYLFIWKIH